MDQKRRKVERERYEETKKPVYVLSHLYEDISSDEEGLSEPVNQLIESDDLEEISVNSMDFDFIDELLGESDSISDERIVISEDGNDYMDIRQVIVCDDTNSDRDNDSIMTETDDNNNRAVTKTTICLAMNRTVRRDPCRTEEITRDSQIVYSEDVNPKDIDFESVA
ncbi:uncharacterized protein LOC134260127 [Saccostrea cucullata]|uniref:uncharacterized protein LOC134260127 n=1 Tax=Saccostrea cuccullata TaxID=36930 RepID=UPI002ED127E4